MLFCGIDTAGKEAAAKTVAMACNCLNRPRSAASPLSTVDGSFDDVNPCGDCSACRKIRSGNHPDLLCIAPSGPIVRVAQIRALCEALSLKPYEARRRFVILSEAQALNPEAGNALLKLLEEPPGRTVFILLAAQASDLLPTIASRCQQVHFRPLSSKDLQTLLVERENVALAEAGVIADLAAGDTARALVLSKPFRGTDGAHWRRWLLEGSGLQRAEELSQRPIGLQLAFAEQLASRREILPEALEFLKAWLRDLIVFKFCPEKIINRDLAERIREGSKARSVAALIAGVDAIQTAQKSIRANANPRLAVEIMMAKLAH